MKVQQHNHVGFFTPVSFEVCKPRTNWGKAVAWSEWYLSLSNEKAVLMRPSTNRVAIQQVKEKYFVSKQALKVASWALGVFALIALVVKSIYRLSGKFEIYNAEESLSKGILVTPKLKADLSKVLPNVFEKQEDSEKLVWFGQKNTLVFGLKNHPNLVFKVLKENESLNRVTLSERYQNAIRVRQTIDIYNLDRIALPSAALIKVGDTQVLIEKSLDAPTSLEDQVEIFQSEVRKDPALLIQFVHLIALTGLNDTTPANNPALPSRPFQPSQIALFDTEMLDNPSEAFITDYKSEGEIKGILTYVPEEHFFPTVRLAQSLGIILDQQKVNNLWQSRFSSDQIAA